MSVKQLDVIQLAKLLNSNFIKVKIISALIYMGYEVETINVDSQKFARCLGWSLFFMAPVMYRRDILLVRVAS
jgi:hypothetical protein